MRTKKIFWQSPRQDHLTTTVTHVDGPKIQLQETIFYAESGGQESDYGTIGGFDVIKAAWMDGDIFYFLDDTHSLKPGDSVDVVIDKERRERLIQQHFAAEVVLELITQNIPNVEKCGAHIAAKNARIDFYSDASLKPEFEWITKQANALLEENLPIESAFEDEEKERRYWKVEGFAKVPCGGTHPSCTGEIGEISLKRKNIGKGKERVEIYVA